jgi:hypothetical protein
VGPLTESAYLSDSRLKHSSCHMALKTPSTPLALTVSYTVRTDGKGIATLVCDRSMFDLLQA